MDSQMRPNSGRKTKIIVYIFHSWIYNYPQVVKSPLTNDHINIYDYITGKLLKT